MSLHPMTELLIDAEQRKYAVPAINFSGVEILYPVLEAAAEARSPVIMQMAASEMAYFGEKAVAGVVTEAVERFGVRAALHLDHGRDYDVLVRCIRNGFTSVMFDGSALPFDENVKTTREITHIAHAAGISVEGELGAVLWAEDADDQNGQTSELTEPEAAAEFAEKTEIDALAVAIGTAHGFYKKAPRLDFNRLNRIRNATKALPLVLHGGTGIPEEAVRQSVREGIRKINFSAMFRVSYIDAFVEARMANPDETRLINLSAIAMAKVRTLAGEIFPMTGSAGMT